ncbi:MULTISPECIES: carboxypeptidase-like regulatory domain-containing protein [Galbibacter]|uniref:Carboxypeptidase-like regulatory domain-containing protein n=1 Tax=Galbibacter pacificus TaxID=2996052 RepID=A0ABT6FLX2_9FLAO|nr:carboxypeptidase-like regulatory domain-containing protein [Galbibacter pacificus]MDG3580786.1 carboxypeptidase-like regulatory domain-containing protein [Galbibacter pacificus]MDG3584264.1 carboxypeptidase-like regulatory domain-containing protein [Galbibacter pacificus]
MQKKIFILYLLIIAPFIAHTQTDGTLIRGKVLYQNTSVPNENVINITTERATITNNEGEFEIMVNVGDELAFAAMNYQLKTVKITEAIIANKRIVVEVNEKVTELDEVVITPENREAYIQLKNEEFKQVDYKTDKATDVTNYAIPVSQRGMKDGLNFVNIYKALFKSNKEKGEEIVLMPSQVLRQVYDDEFFVTDLKVPQDQIDEFLYYVDDKLPSKTLLKKSNEFELIDFLVDQSKEFNALKASEN